ncbi:hypothetical protein BDZ89DRAFT_1167998 [Hymenopellis radicata]|nr:hypothetical protein BDZ89DRAFT_1167998 [Hymenopellis radicata]
MSEINPGIWDGLSPDQARKYYPQDWERFVKDPYAFRAPRAESSAYASSQSSRETEDLLIIGHASVIRYCARRPARGRAGIVRGAQPGVPFLGRARRRGDEDAEATDKDENNFYENYAEDTKGKRKTMAHDPAIELPSVVLILVFGVTPFLVGKALNRAIICGLNFMG